MKIDSFKFKNALLNKIHKLIVISYVQYSNLKSICGLS